MLRFFLISFILFSTGRHSCGQEPRRDSTRSPHSVKILPVPALGYAPETGFYIGAVSLFTFDLYRDSFSRISNAKVEFNYTWKKQVILEAGWNYFFRRERWFTRGLLRYSEYPDLYFGVGPNTPESYELQYMSERWVADVDMLRNLGSRVFAGPRVRYLDYRHVHYEEKPLFPELVSSVSWGAGYTVLKDSRDNLLNATRGVYLEWSNTFDRAGGRTYSKFYADARVYTTPFAGTVAALRIYNELSPGDPPFFDYALFGGDKLARGYFYGRFREKNLFLVQSEIRQHIWRRIGLAVFGGAGNLYPDLQKLSLAHLKPNYGAGIRFLADRKERINLRLDYGMGTGGQSGFFIAFGESF